MKLTIKKFVLLYVVLAIVGLSLVAGMNYYYDPAHVFSNGKYEKSVADILLSGKDVANVSNLNYRTLQKDYISGLKEKKDVIVLGSSRSMLIGSDLFPGQTFYNSSMTIATLEDYLAIYSLLEKQNIVPSTIILGLDPWILTGDPGKTEWLTIKEDYFAMLTKLGIKYDNSYGTASDIATKLGINVLGFSELISLRYTRASFTSMLSGKSPGEIVAGNNDESVNGGILADGSHVYPDYLMNPDINDLEKTALEESANQIAAEKSNSGKINEKLVETLTKFLDYLKQKNVSVIIYLPPLYPTLYDNITQSEGNVTVKTEALLKEIAANHGAKIAVAIIRPIQEQLKKIFSIQLMQK